MQHNQGVPPQAGSGYSAEPEPSCTVSAVPVSIPNALKLIEHVSMLQQALAAFVDIRDQFPESGKLINKALGGLAPVQVTVTKDQFLAAVNILRATRA